MRGTQWCASCVVLACWVMGCGEAPPAPTAVPEAQRVGAGSKGQTETDVLTVRPSPDAVLPTPDTPSSEADPSVEAAEEPADPEPPEPEPEPSAAQQAQVFTACQETRLVGCDAVYVRMVTPEVCVQLILDNCGTNGRQGLPVTLPISWRLASGSASTDPSCDVREYDPKSLPALSASGAVSFAQRGRQISALEIDVSLRVDAPPESKLPTQIEVTTAAPITAIDSCVL